MSRHSRIVIDLDGLTEHGTIDGWVRDSDPRDPNRVQWILQAGPANRLHLTTGEAEAFITGAKSALLVKGQG